MKKLLALILVMISVFALAQEPPKAHVDARRQEGMNALDSAKSLLRQGNYKAAETACDQADRLMMVEPGRRNINVSIMRGEIFLAKGKSDYPSNEKAFKELSGGYRFNRDQRHDLLMAIAAARVGNERVAKMALGNPVSGADHYLLRRGIEASSLPGMDDLKEMEARACILLAAYPDSLPVDAVEYGSRALILVPGNRAAEFLCGIAFVDMKEHAKARPLLRHVATGSDTMAAIAKRNLAAITSLG